MGMILRIASSRIVGQGDIVGRSGYFSLNLSANSVMRGRLDARRTLKSLVADLRVNKTKANKHTFFISSILIVQPLLQNANYHFTKLLKKTVKPILSQEINQAFSIHQNSIAILYLTLGRCFAGK